MKPRKYTKWKISLGVLLWIVVPKHGTFVMPTTSREFVLRPRRSHLVVIYYLAALVGVRVWS
jgi:hypothetical protein